LEDCPSGPWVAAGTPAAEEDDDPEYDAPDVVWQTGTAVDEFTPVYRSLALWTQRHGPLAPSEVDGMDISLIAVLMGVDAQGSMLGAHQAWIREWKAAQDSGVTL
jgi:hypothetical protein